jgi:hypothetical protein
MSRSFAPHVLMSQAVEFVMHERHQLLKRTLVAPTPFHQKLRDLMRRDCH